MGVCQAAIRLHEEKTYSELTGALWILLAAQLAGNLLDIAPQDGGEIGIHDRRVATADQLHQGADLMADGDLREAELTADRGNTVFLPGATIAQHSPGGARRAAGV